MLAYASLAVSRTLLQRLLACLSFILDSDYLSFWYKRKNFYELWQQHKQFKTMEMSEVWPDSFDEGIVCVGVSTSPPPFQNHPSPLLGSPPFFKIPHPPTSPANRSSQVFLINRDATVKLSSINTIHVKQQHNVGFFSFQFFLKYMLGNVYIN